MYLSQGLTSCSAKVSPSDVKLYLDWHAWSQTFHITPRIRLPEPMGKKAQSIEMKIHSKKRLFCCKRKRWKVHDSQRCSALRELVSQCQTWSIQALKLSCSVLLTGHVQLRKLSSGDYPLEHHRSVSQYRYLPCKSYYFLWVTLHIKSFRTYSRM